MAERQTSLDRALDIFEALAGDEPALSLGQLSSRLGMPKPTVRRVLINLMDRGYVEQESQTRQYRLGLRCWHIGAAAVAVTDLRTVAKGRLESLATVTGEQATLWIYDDGDATCVDRAEAPQRVRSFTRLGTREPTIALATGRCLLATQSAEEIDRVLSGLGEDRLDCRSIEDWRDHLKLVAERGFDVSREDRWEGVSAVGAAIRDHDGVVVAAVGVSGPSQRIEAQVDALVTELGQAADTMSAHLGHTTDR